VNYLLCAPGRRDAQRGLFWILDWVLPAEMGGGSFLKVLDIAAASWGPSVYLLQAKIFSSGLLLCCLSPFNDCLSL
jgi:hypothetical protein